MNIAHIQHISFSIQDPEIGDFEDGGDKCNSNAIAINKKGACNVSLYSNTKVLGGEDVRDVSNEYKNHEPTILLNMRNCSKFMT